MDSEEIEAKLEAVLKENERLQHENQLLDDYLMRHPPDEEEESAQDKKGSRKKAELKKKEAEKHLSLTAEQKHAIAKEELEVVKAEMELSKNKQERLVEELRAVIEETEIRIAEVKKEAYEFKRDIVVGAENPRTGKTMAEKILRYNEEKLKQKDLLIEKLRLKNSVLKSQCTRLETQLSQKEEMGDVLHVIDFDQLKIENQQYLEKIEERNNELLRLKLTTGNTVQVLNNLKKKLNNITAESEWLKREIQQREDALSKITEEIEKVAREEQTAKRINRHLKLQQYDGEVPEILDYVIQKAEVYDLIKEVSNWERKVEIAELAAKRQRKLVKDAAANSQL